MATRRRTFFEGPWPWLIYLPFYALPWLWRGPQPWQLAAFIAGLAVFLPAYVIGYRMRGWRLILAAAVVLAVGVSLSRAGGNWTVFPIYAAAMAGLLKPVRHALIAVGVIVAVTLGLAMLLRLGFVWWLPGAILILTTGAATASREAHLERTEALLKTQEEVRRLAGLAERERITRDLHDLVGRTLTLIALKADLAVKLLARDADASSAELRAIGDAARTGLGEVRAALAGQWRSGLSHEVKASMAALDAANIDAALDGQPEDVPAGAGAILAMTLREAVTNVIRHSEASRCAIAVTCRGNTAELVVHDDGPAPAVVEGNGLSGMRQRLAAAGGALTVAAGLPGVRLSARVPA